jgi:hypothetical protein
MAVIDQENNKETRDELSSPFPSPERWRTDPFDCFPIEMRPYMHDLLNLCEFECSLFDMLNSYEIQTSHLRRGVLLMALL